MWGGGPQIPDAAYSAGYDLTMERANAAAIEAIALLGQDSERLFGANDGRHLYSLIVVIATAKAGLSTKGGGE